MDIKNLLSGQLDLAQMNATQPAGLDRVQVQGQTGQKSSEAMHKAGQEFEAYFISYAYRQHCVSRGQREAQFKLIRLQYAHECTFDFERYGSIIA